MSDFSVPSITTSTDTYQSSSWTMTADMKGGYYSESQISVSVSTFVEIIPAVFGVEIGASYNVFVIHPLIINSAAVFSSTLQLFATTNFSQSQTTSTSSQYTW
jgi:hypothetical protein